MNYKNFIKLGIVAFCLIVASSCGKDDSHKSSGTSTISTAASTTCTTGYVYSSSYGCIPQGSCPYGYGAYTVNGVTNCVVATNTTTTTTSTCQGSCSAGYVRTAYGCLPLDTSRCGSNTCVGYLASSNYCIYGY